MSVRPMASEPRLVYKRAQHSPNYNPYTTDAQITGVWSPGRLSFYGGAPIFAVGRTYNCGA